MKKIVYLILGFSFTIIGFMYLINSILATTTLSGDLPGLYLSPSSLENTRVNGFFGAGFLAFGIFFLSKTRERKRGQVAMEFLMTYGWAILAAIISISVLALFGVFSPEQLASSSAIVTPPFYANAWNVQERTGGLTSPSGVVLELRNNGGQNLNLRNITIEGESGTWTGQCSNNNPPPIGDKESEVIEIPCMAGIGDAGDISGPVLSAGDTFKGDITITYRKPGSNLDLTSTGTITDTVVE